MDNQNIQEQINELNLKMDLVLKSLDQQNRKAESVEDLFADLQIIGKDMYDTAVVELENQQVELDIDQLKYLGLKLLNNINDITVMLSVFESTVDFARDAGPLVRESIIDMTKTLHEFEKKGYFEFFTEIGKVVDNLVTHFTKEDVASLADNIVLIVDTMRKMTQPEMMLSMQKTLDVFNSIDKENVPQYSLLKLIKELNKPEMKKAMGFAVTFMKSISKTNGINA